MYADTSIKNEDTWYRVLGHYDAEYDTTPRVFKGWWNGRHFVHFVRNHDGNLNVPYVYDDGNKVVVNWNWLDNDWNDNNPAARFATLSFLSCFCGRVLF
jgi:hypothetical protein